MPIARRVIIIHPDGEMIISECPIVEDGPARTTCIDVEGIAYFLFRYAALTRGGMEQGYIAAPTSPTAEDRARLSCVLFGPGEEGIRQLEPIQPWPSAPPVPPVRAPQVREMAPSGIVLRIAFRDGGVEDVFGERCIDPSLLAGFPNAICAYRFLRPSTNQFLPWVPVTMHDLVRLRAALTYRIGIHTGGSVATIGLSHAATA